MVAARRGTIAAMSAACPKCFLPKDDDAWQCDGCGHEFTRDYEAVRTSLQAELRRSQVGLIVSIFVGAVLACVVVYMAMHGKVIISIPLLVGVFASIGHYVHRGSVLRGHLRDLDRRHVPLPKATAHIAP